MLDSGIKLTQFLSFSRFVTHKIILLKSNSGCLTLDNIEQATIRSRLTLYPPTYTLMSSRCDGIPGELLTVTRVTVKDSGVYGCLANNNRSQHSSSVQIDVQGTATVLIFKKGILNQFDYNTTYF